MYILYTCIVADNASTPFHVIIIVLLLQLVQGSQGNIVIPSLPTLTDHIPRSWNLSNDGTLVVVGFEDGALQVRTYLYTLIYSESVKPVGCAIM